MPKDFCSISMVIPSEAVKTVLLYAVITPGKSYMCIKNVSAEHQAGWGSGIKWSISFNAF